jgi:hypothetical protein
LFSAVVTVKRILSVCPVGVSVDEPTGSGVVVAMGQQQQGGTRYAVAGAGLIIRVIAPLTAEAHR